MNDHIAARTKVTSSVCGACFKSQEKCKFSKTQWKRRSQRRCLPCVDSDTPLMSPEELRKEIDQLRDRCGYYQCHQETKESRKLCNRCKRIAYCSKSCQTADWKRHKKVECLGKKKDSKLAMLGIEPDEIKSATAKAFEKFWEASRKVAEEKKAGTDTWKEDLQLGNAPPKGGHLSAALFEFTTKYYVQIASFAAVHIAKYPRLKGALFLFTNLSIFDLTNVNPDAPESNKLDRSFALAWGYRYKNGDPHHSGFSISDLACEHVLDRCSDKFMTNVNGCSLTTLMNTYCDKKSFPLVICADPSGEILRSET